MSSAATPQSADPTVEIARRSDIPGRLVSRYRLLEKLGEGTHAAVYRACDDTTGRVLAFKQLLGQATAAERALQEALFAREYHTLIRLKHPRVLEVFDYGVSEAGPFYTMELLEGQDLHQLAPLPYRDVCAHLCEIASVLVLLQTQRLVHRDISPRNVRITPAGCARLLDFGTLHAFGICPEQVGTPACVAPESYWGMPLDQRADLFALGAVGYFALTGRHAFPAQDYAQLPALWRNAPRPPSRIAADVPPALDALVLSLLSVDPRARPASPADVIDALSTIAQLAREPESALDAAHPEEAPSPRAAREPAAVRALVPGLLAGRGAVALLEGPAGIGKTQLLHQLALEAQLGGAIVLKADAEARGGDFGVARQLALALMRRHPELGRACAQSNAGLLAHLSPALRAALHVEQPASVSNLPGEHAARLRRALHDWLHQLARAQPVCLVIDNLHAADEDSSAVLARLGAECATSALLLLLSERTSESQGPSRYARALRERATRLSLADASLDAAPQARGPAKLGGLAYEARRMADVLCIHERPLPLPLCLAFAEAGPEQAHWALQELLRTQILVSEGGHYRFAREGVRAQLLAELDEGLRRAFHLRAAEVLLEQFPQRGAEQVEAAEHLLRGGEELRAADQLAAAARRAVAGGEPSGSPEHLIALLRETVDSPALQQRPQAELAGLLLPMVLLAASAFDVRTLIEYGERALDLGLGVTGLNVAESLRPRLGRRLALSVGLVRAGTELRVRRHSAPGVALRDFVVLLCGAAPPVLSTLMVCNQVATVERIVDKLRALTLFGPGHLVSLIHQLALDQLRIARGQFGEALSDFAAIRAHIDNPALRRELGEERWAFMYGEALLTTAQLCAYGFGEGAVRLCDEAAELPLCGLAAAIDARRWLHHAFRGESELGRPFRQRVEHGPGAEGAPGQVELLMASSLFNLDLLVGDATAARHNADQLARLARVIPSLQVYADAADAGYRLLCGQITDAREQYARAVERLPPRASAWWLTIRTQYAHSLNLAADHQAARRVLLDAISYMTAADESVALHALETRRQLAVALAGLGDVATARGLLDQLLAREAGEHHPLLFGVLHKSAAELALQTRALRDFQRHFAAMQQHFRATSNPALLAQCDRLAAQASAAGLPT